MAAKDNTSFIVNSVIGEGTEFRGEFNIKGILRIDGFFSGTIKSANKVIVSKTGKVKTDITANEVTVGGEVEGNIFAKDFVKILHTGRVKGDIITPHISIEEGGTFEGNCKINKDAF